MWKVRKKNGGAEMPLAGDVVLQRILDGLFSDQFEFLPPGQTHWIDRQAAVERLMAGEQAAAAPAPAVAPTPSAPVPRPAPVKPLAATQPIPSIQPPQPRTTFTPPSPPARPVPPPVPATKPAGSRWAGEVTLPPAPPIPPAANVAPVFGPTAGAATSVRSRVTAGAEDIDAEFDMTPMIDVVFQLLIFFMVAGSISAFTKLQLPESTSGKTEDPTRRVVMVLDLPPKTTLPAAGGGALVLLGEAILYFADEPDRRLDAQQLPQELASKFAAHRQKLLAENAPEAGAPLQFILMAHSRAPSRLVRQVLTLARDAGAQDQLVGVSMSQGSLSKP